MIKLFYTGAEAFNTPQTLASKSLGSYISNTAIPNGVINSLFPSLSISEFYSSKKITQYIGLGLYLFFFDDETSYDNINLQFVLNYSEDNDSEADFFKDLFEYQIGLGPISGDNVNGYYLEKITSGAKPYYMLQDFQKIILGAEIEFKGVELNQGGVGVWLSRTFNPKLFKEKFRFDSSYWEDHEKIPTLDLAFELKNTFTPVIKEENPIEENPIE